jgi:hypothetical protein
MADRIRRFALITVVLPFLLLAMAGSARATFITVNTLDGGSDPAPLCTLKDAVTAANNEAVQNGCAAGSGNDTILFAPSLSGTITLSSSLPDIETDLTIEGPATGGIAISGHQAVELISIGMLNPAIRTVALRNLTFTEGESEFGGAINNNGVLTVNNCTFSDNHGNGGAIVSIGTLTVTNSTFVDNSALVGGALGGTPGPAGKSIRVVNSTFYGNTATQAGAIFAGGVTLEVDNSTFLRNTASLGGSIFSTLSVAKLKGVILAGSPGANNCFGMVTDNSFNISDDDSCGFTAGDSRNNTNPMLDPAGLADNGGPTETIALQSGSPAIGFDTDCTDQAMPPNTILTDQRLFKRPNSPTKCDSGAYEHDGVPPIALIPNSERVQVVHSPAPSSDMVNMAFTFADNGSPPGPCDSGNDALNGIEVLLFPGGCANPTAGGLILGLAPFVVHTVNHVSYGTFFGSTSTGTEAARIVQISPTPAGACGEWSINIEVSGTNAPLFVSNPLGLIIEDLDGNAECFDIDNAIIGNQIPTPPKTRRRRVRR